MKTKHGHKIRKNDSERLLEQSLSKDYWDGYYSLGCSDIARFSDYNDRCARITIISLDDGIVKDEFDVCYQEESVFSFLSDTVFEKGYGKIGLRLSDSLGNPDREEMINAILERKDPSELLKIKVLIDSLRTRSICGFGGRMGNQILSDLGYEGYYKLSDGSILLCKDLKTWDYGSVNRIADGVAICIVLKPDRFSVQNSKTTIHPYLDEDRFSDIMEEMSEKGTAVDSILARKGDELFDILSKALDGDKMSASIASHRLRCEIRIPS